MFIFCGLTFTCPSCSAFTVGKSLHYRRHFKL